MHRIESLARCLAFNALWAVAAAAGAEDIPKGGEPRLDASMEVSGAQLVKTGLYLIPDGGANSLLRFTANGLILVDGKLPGRYRALMSQVRKVSRLSDMSVRVLVVTDHHESKTGNNAQFLAAHVPVIAQDNVGRSLASYRPSVGTIPPPTVSFDREYTIKLGGVEARLLHFGSAHTNGDTVVYFPNLKVVAVGDLFATGPPDPDFANGGSLVGWPQVLDHILQLDFDTVVPSTGPTVTRADLEAFKAKIETLVMRAKALAAKDVGKIDLLGQLKTDDLGWTFSFNREQLDRFYSELVDTKQGR